MANLDVSSLLYCDNLRLKGGVQVERRGVPQPTRLGEVREQIAELVTIDPVVIHNASGRDLVNVPEADRSAEFIAGKSEQRVYVDDSDYTADVVLYNGRRWRVVQVQDYFEQGGVYLWTAALIERGAR